MLVWRAAAHVHLGFGTFAEYVERLLGYSPRSTHEKLRVAEALERKIGSSLHDLGFRAADVGTVLADLREEASAHPSADDATPSITTERLLRAALMRLGPKRSARR